MKTTALVLFSAVLLSVACTATQSIHTDAVAQAHRPGLVTRIELDARRGQKVAQAIRAIDPSMLVGRGEPLQVWVDGTSYTVDYLEGLSADDVLEIRKLSAADARQMFGDRATGAGLVVRLRQR